MQIARRYLLRTLRRLGRRRRSIGQLQPRHFPARPSPPSSQLAAARNTRGTTQAWSLWCLVMSCGFAASLAEMPQEYSADDDVFNQELLIQYFSPLYYADRFSGVLPEKHLTELEQIVSLALEHPVLAMGAAQCSYMFGWYGLADGNTSYVGKSRIDWANVEAAAALFELSAAQGGCKDPSLPLVRFLDELSCDIRLTHATFLHEYLSHEYRVRLNEPEKAAQHFSRAQAMLQDMLQTQRFAGECCAAWTHPGHVNMNALFFPHAFSAPIWPRERATALSITAFLEEHVYSFKSEILQVLEGVHRDEWAAVAPNTVTAEHLASRDGWFMLNVVKHGTWNSLFCEIAPRTCELLASRPEISRCAVSNVNVMQLSPGGSVKPHFGNAPRLTAHLALTVPEPEAVRIRVGHEEATWIEGEVLIIDDTFVHTVRHVGTLPRVVLTAWFCHPCDTNPDFQHGQTCQLK